MDTSISSAATEKNQLTINDLDDDSLGIIFNKLPYTDRVRIESVCQRWDAISEDNWSTYCKRLAIDKNLLSSCYNNTRNENKNVLEKVLERTGPYLEEVTFERSIDLCCICPKGMIKRIAELCPKLKRLNTGFIKLNGDDWLPCSNLESLSFICWGAKLQGDCIGKLFRNNKRLRRLEIFRNDSLTASDFDHLDPGQLEFLQIENCPIFELTAEIADKLAESLVELRYRNMWYDSPTNFQHFRKLKNLRSLVLKNVMEWYELKFIADIAKYHRKLEYLFLGIFIDRPYEQNDVFAPLFDLPFMPLFDLPYLRRLVIIVDEHNVPSEDQLARLVQRAAHLEFFQIDTCKECRNGFSILISCHRHDYHKRWLS